MLEAGALTRNDGRGRLAARPLRRAALTGLFLFMGFALSVGAALADDGGAPDLETRRLYLSGTGRSDAVEWDFSIDRGRGRVGRHRIPVPSQWELEGFGEYAYGRHDGVRAETGRYSLRFEVPAGWSDRRVRLVFEGSMTDTEASVNGTSAGPVHRGGFTRFGYDVGELLRFGESNLLEVTVSEASADPSVNAAERDADYWVFGGIYRPVYLEASPPEAIEHVAIDARHDGRLRVLVETVAAPEAVVEAVVLDGEGRAVAPALGSPIVALEGASASKTVRTELSGRIEGVRAWSAEHPELYLLEVSLRRGGKTLHVRRERFGFRTVEIRPGDGIFVNGRRILLKGINRHSFWPDSGRALDPEINRRDAELIKQLNANAVRASHYPPDIEFLDAADELGLYVIDELPGWHDAYAAPAGRRLVAEMVRRDVNHPSVILWANGNEGGWNRLVDPEFARHDPQERPVLHPQAEFSGIDTEHYPSWDELAALVDDGSLRNRILDTLLGWWRPLPLVLPTEILHGLYDGGLGAGLADYWELIRGSRRGAGAFLWAFVDEGVVRTDRGGEIDTFGNYAPDGLLGPYREPEGSFYAVREIWSPIVLAEAKNLPPGGAPAPLAPAVRVTLENRFDETDLTECSFGLEWLDLPGPFDRPEIVVLGRAEVRGPALAPGDRGELRIGPAETAQGAEPDALRITARDPSGRAVAVRVYPLRSRALLRQGWTVSPGAEAEASGARAAELALLGVGSQAGIRSFSRRASDGGLVIEMRGEPNFSGSYQGLTLEFLDGARGPDGAPEEIEALEWLGEGPATVWANRRQGGTLGLWRKEAAGRPASWKGFYAGVLWIKLIGRRWTVTVVPSSGATEADGEDAELFVGVSSPEFPADAEHARAEVPPGGVLSILFTIPAIGTKFHPAERTGPRGRAPVSSQSRRGSAWLRVEPTRAPL